MLCNIIMNSILSYLNDLYIQQCSIQYKYMKRGNFKMWKAHGIDFNR